VKKLDRPTSTSQEATKTNGILERVNKTCETPVVRRRNTKRDCQIHLPFLSPKERLEEGKFQASNDSVRIVKVKPRIVPKKGKRKAKKNSPIPPALTFDTEILNTVKSVLNDCIRTVELEVKLSPSSSQYKESPSPKKKSSTARARKCNSRRRLQMTSPIM